MALGEFWTLYPKLLRIPAGQLYPRGRTPHRQNLSLSHLHLVTRDSRKVFSGVLAVVEPAFEVSWTSIPPKPPRWTHPCNSIDLQMEILISTKCTLWQVPGTSIFVQHLVPSPGPAVQPQLVTIKQDKMDMSNPCPPSSTHVLQYAIQAHHTSSCVIPPASPPRKLKRFAAANTISS